MLRGFCLNLLVLRVRGVSDEPPRTLILYPSPSTTFSVWIRFTQIYTTPFPLLVYYVVPVRDTSLMSEFPRLLTHTRDRVAVDWHVGTD